MEAGFRVSAIIALHTELGVTGCQIRGQLRDGLRVKIDVNVAEVEVGQDIFNTDIKTRTEVQTPQQARDIHGW